MTDLSRRGLFKAGGLAACAAALPAAHAAQKKTSGGPDLADNPAARASGARFAPEAGTLPTSDLSLTDTFNLGCSTLDEGDIITASRWGVVRGHVQGGKLVRVTPFEHDYAPSVNLPGLRHLPYSPSRIRYPMVREGYLKKGPASRANRGKEKFVRNAGRRKETALPHAFAGHPAAREFRVLQREIHARFQRLRMRNQPARCPETGNQRWRPRQAQQSARTRLFHCTCDNPRQTWGSSYRKEQLAPHESLRYRHGDELAYDVTADRPRWMLCVSLYPRQR